MYVTAPTLDDLLRRVFERLLKSSNHIKPTKGPATELMGVLLKIANPRARLSRTETKGTLFSCLGELLWYLARTNDVRFISYYIPDYKKYSDDGKAVYGAYGPRLFKKGGHNQVAKVVRILRKKPHSRQAVIQLFDAVDIDSDHKHVPCTCTLQFMVRRSRLYMLTNMRSNDAFLGLPHDVFAFTMLQEIIARMLSIELGTYKHVVGSLHLYEKDRERAQRYLDEGWQSTVPMPAMPLGSVWHSILTLLDAEARIRSGRRLNIRKLNLSRYWADFVYLLQIFRYSKNGRTDKIAHLTRRISTNIYNTYIEKRRSKRPVTAVAPEQLPPAVN